MTSIGTQRKIDSLGRIVIPKEFRNFFSINSEDIVEIKMTTDGILIKKPEYEVRKIECSD